MNDKPLPTIDPDSAPFWAACGEGRLDLPNCRACDKPHFPPRALCPHCHEVCRDWRTAAGTGTIHTFTIARRPAHPGFKDELPYVVALIDLDEGVRIMSNIITDNPDAIAIGQRVEVVFDKVADDLTMPKFQRID